MRRLPIHVALVLTFFAAVASVASAATTTYTGPPLFTVPSKTVKTEVACSTCLPADQGKKSVGYEGLISTFAGRFNDSALDGEGYSFPRPLRVWQMKYNAAHDRLYMRVGSYLVAPTIVAAIARWLFISPPTAFNAVTRNVPRGHRLSEADTRHSGGSARWRQTHAHHVTPAPICVDLSRETLVVFQLKFNILGLNADPSEVGVGDPEPPSGYSPTQGDTHKCPSRKIF